MENFAEKLITDIQNKILKDIHNHDLVRFSYEDRLCIDKDIIKKCYESIDKDKVISEVSKKLEDVLSTKIVNHMIGEFGGDIKSLMCRAEIREPLRNELKKKFDDLVSCLSHNKDKYMECEPKEAVIDSDDEDEEGLDSWDIKFFNDMDSPEGILETAKQHLDIIKEYSTDEDDMRQLSKSIGVVSKCLKELANRVKDFKVYLEGGKIIDDIPVPMKEGCGTLAKCYSCTKYNTFQNDKEHGVCMDRMRVMNWWNFCRGYTRDLEKIGG